MPALVHSKFEEEPIIIKCTSMETPFFNYKSMEIFFDAQEHVTSKSVIQYHQNSNSSEILCLSWFDEDQIKTEGISLETSFSPL